MLLLLLLLFLLLVWFRVFICLVCSVQVERMSSTGKLLDNGRPVAELTGLWQAVAVVGRFRQEWSVWIDARSGRPVSRGSTAWSLINNNNRTYSTENICFISDIDECSAESAPCDQNAECTNNDGSYSCLCKQGFTGDGKTCQGTSPKRNSLSWLWLWLWNGESVFDYPQK